MEQRRNRYLSATLLALCTLFSTSNSSAQVDLFYDDLLPQAYSNTCQSQSIMMALAAADHPAFQLDTPNQVRAAEVDFRALIEKIARETSGADTTTHSVWKKAITRYTQGHFTLKSKFYADANEWARKIADVTGNTTSPETYAVTQVFGPGTLALTSVTRVGSPDLYRSGHIVSVMGIEDRTVNNSSERHFMLVLNGAIKGSDTARVSCEASDLPGDSRYSAGVLPTSDYTLKKFGGGLGYLVMWLEPN